MKKIIRLKPVFKERLWGGQKLKSYFSYDIEEKPIGECWAISAHKNGACQIINEEYKDETLLSLYEKYKNELFDNDPSKVFPLLVKILDANTQLSVQVHPEDEYALKHENDLGKTECWYVIDAKDDANIIYGHTAKNKDEFSNKIKTNDLSLWHYQSIKPQDFIYVPATTVHAINEGTFIYEVQESSDTTYRIYDYDRRDDKGNTRELHLDKALDIINFPAKKVEQNTAITINEDYKLYHYVSNKYFDVNRYVISSKASISFKTYALVSVLNGEATILGEKVLKGDHFIIPSTLKDTDIEINGKCELMVTYRTY